jgi:hypothetical protein
MRVLVAVVFLAAICAAQMPSRAELLKKAKYVEDAPKAEFKTYTETDIRGAIQVVSARSYAMFGYNTPEVQIVLPKNSNSIYSTIDFPDPELVDAGGKPVAVSIERGGFDPDTSADEIRFNPAEGEGVVDFARVSGTIKLKYPLSVKTQTFTPAQLGAKNLGVKINGPFVSFSDDAIELPDVSFGKLKPVRAYDAAGKQLEAAGYSETATDNDGVLRKKMAFYGNVARLEIDTVADWAELELPYDLKPAPMLPAGHEGENPDSYKQ